MQHKYLPGGASGGWVGTGLHTGGDCRLRIHPCLALVPKPWLSGSKAERTRTVPMEHTVAQVSRRRHHGTCGGGGGAWVARVCPVLQAPVGRLREPDAEPTSGGKGKGSTFRSQKKLPDRPTRGAGGA